MVDVVCGLDFGTSNSTLALIKDTKPFLVRIDQERSTIPSAIFYNFEDDSTQFGQRAIDDYVQGTEGRLLRSLKSILGTALVTERTQLRRRSLAFTEIIAEFLHHMKVSTEARYGISLRQVVAGRPVHFIDDDAHADRNAEREFEGIIKSVGFETVEFQYEPIAAAYQYNSTAGTSGDLAFIVDIGGGTSDFSIVKTEPKNAEHGASVLATHGVHLGGNDIDRIVSLDAIMPMLGLGSAMRDKELPVPSWLYNDLATWHKINGLYTTQIRALVRQIMLEATQPALIGRLLQVLEQRRGHFLLSCAESTKIKLSEAKSISMPLAVAAGELTLELSAAQLSSILENWSATIRAAVQRTLEIGNVASRDIRTVFLTGGTTSSPVVRGMIKGLLPRAEIVSGDNFGAVGLGLAIDAERRFRI